MSGRDDRTRRAVAVVATTAVLGMAGVLAVMATDREGGPSASESGDTPHPAGVLPSAAGPPGTLLGDGFEVVDGTTLLGDPIPFESAGLVDGEVEDGWTATLVVDGGDPQAILDAYLDQAEASGLTVRSGVGCGATDEVVECSAVAARPAGDDAPAYVEVAILRGRNDDLYSDHVVIWFSPSPEVPSRDHLEPGDGVVGLPAQEPWPPLPDVGGTIGTAGETRHNLRIEPGSRLAGPPRLYRLDSTGGVWALLEVTGDPTTVVDGYLGQLDDGFAPPERTVDEIAGARLTQTETYSPGGDYFRFVIVEREGRPVWLVITGAHD